MSVGPGYETVRVPLELDPCAVEEWMANDPDWILSLAEDMTPEDIRALYDRHRGSTCPSQGVLSEIAAHENTPHDIVRELARKRRRCVHLSLALNPRLPPELLSKVARNAKIDVLEHLIWNRNTLLAELERLAGHARSRYVRELALEDLERRHRTQSTETRS